RHAAIHAAADAVRRAAERASGTGIGPRLADELRLLLEERRRRLEGPGGPVIPARVPASRFKDYVDDPGAVSEQLRRPMPQRPYRATRIGTLFHTWVEHRSTGLAEAAAIDDDWPGIVLGVDGEPDGRGDEVVTDATPERLRALQATFEASEWGDRLPIAVELELHLPIEQHVFVCKLDAVYEVPPGGELAARGIRYQVVDWKTGAAPRDAHDLELKQTQLALYRLAYAKWAGLEPEQVDAVFYFVEDDRIIRPERLYDEAALRRSWGSVAGASRVTAGVRPAGSAASPQSLRSSGMGAVASIGADGRSPASRRSSSEKS
ncbi:MAG TPA: PD-(D/E)XK nuclease family protein, partial [Agromyces sp.]